MEQRIHSLIRQKLRIERASLGNTDERRARTRTLIQLGGLIEKSGLLEKLGLRIGADLQKDEEMYQPMLQLFGALCDIKEQLAEEPDLPLAWAYKGKVTFGGGLAAQKEVA